MLADIRIVQFENSPMRVDHSARDVSRTEDNHIFLCRQTSGFLKLEQAGRDISLEAGGLVLLDPELPYRAKFSGESKSLALKLPRRAQKPARERRAKKLRFRCWNHRKGAAIGFPL